MNSLQNTTNPAPGRTLGTSAPEAPVSSPEPVLPARMQDPASHRGQSTYPIPAFFEYRVHARSREAI